MRAFFAENVPDIQIEKLDRSSETSWLSAAWNIKPAQIAKTLSLRVGERSIMLVTCGDLRLDNGKIKAVLGGKAKMLRSDEASAITGHTVGGICPFGLATPLPVYCDVLLREFDLVVTGAGSTHCAIRKSRPSEWRNSPGRHGWMFVKTSRCDASRPSDGERPAQRVALAPSVHLQAKRRLISEQRPVIAQSRTIRVAGSAAFLGKSAIWGIGSTFERVGDD